MMKAFIAGIVAVASFSPALVGMSAHHPLAEVFARESAITLTGTVTALRWMNPHVLLYIDVEGEAGELQNWALEMDPPSSLMRRGWGRDSLRVGDAITVTGYRALDDTLTTAVRTIALPSGERLSGTTDFSWNWGNEPPVP